MPESVVLLHGFGGTHRAWDGVIAALDRERYRPLALDLPGHGEAADAERPITFAGCVAHVLARSPERFTLCGYSMGGRVALHVALAAPERVARLVLVSCSAGIEDDAERARAAARPTGRSPTSSNGSRSRSSSSAGASQPLFAAEPPEVGALAREDQRRNRPDALAAVLRGIGTGEMRAAVGAAGRAGDARHASSPASATPKFRALGRRGWSSCCQHAELLDPRGRPRPGAREPARGGGRACRRGGAMIVGQRPIRS